MIHSRLCTLLSFLIANSTLGQSVPPNPLADESRIALEGRATVVALSRDSEVLVIVIDRFQVDVYSALNGKRLVQFPGQKAPVHAVAISACGRWMATGGALETVENDLLDKYSENQIRPGDRRNTLGRGASTSQDDKEHEYQLPLQIPLVNPRSVSYRGGCVTVWDSKSGEPHKEVRDYPDPIVAVSFRGDETGLATLDAQFAYRSLALNGPGQPAVENNNRVRFNKLPSPQTSFSSDGVRIASLEATAQDRGNINIKLFDSNKRRLRAIPARGAVVPWSVAMSPDGQSFVSAGSGGAISVWGFEAAEVVRTFEHPDKRSILFVAFSDDGKFVVTYARGGLLCLWDVKGGRLLLTTEVSKQDIRAVAFGKELLTVVSGGFLAEARGVTPILIQRINLHEALRGP